MTSIIGLRFTGLDVRLTTRNWKLPRVEMVTVEPCKNQEREIDDRRQEKEVKLKLHLSSRQNDRLDFEEITRIIQRKEEHLPIHDTQRSTSHSPNSNLIDRPQF
jgi:hypothetical protein